MAPTVWCFPVPPPAPDPEPHAALASLHSCAPRTQARAVAPTVWCSRPDLSLVRKAASDTQLVSVEWAARSGALHTSIVRSKLFFPDRRLLQFDCGKLQVRWAPFLVRCYLADHLLFGARQGGVLQSSRRTPPLLWCLLCVSQLGLGYFPGERTGPCLPRGDRAYVACLGRFASRAAAGAGPAAAAAQGRRPPLPHLHAGAPHGLGRTFRACSLVERPKRDVRECARHAPAASPDLGLC